MNVWGLDLSTARIGAAAGDGELLSITTKVKANDPYRRLYELRRQLAWEIRRRPPRPDLVVVEDYSLGSPGRLSLIRLGEIGGIVRTALFESAIPIALVRPSTLKRFATGRGGASKEEMIDAAIRQILATNPQTWIPANDDEADAYHLRRMGRMANGLVQAVTDYELDALSVVEWPALVDGEAPAPTPATGTPPVRR